MNIPKEIIEKKLEEKYLKENGVFVKITKDGIKIKATKEYMENIKNINKMGDTI